MLNNTDSNVEALVVRLNTMFKTNITLCRSNLNAAAFQLKQTQQDMGGVDETGTLIATYSNVHQQWFGQPEKVKAHLLVV